MNGLRVGLTVALGLSVAGCVSLPRRDGLRSAHLERLYFGRNIGDSAVVSDSAWAVFVHETITPSFPEGATVWDAAGQWRAPDGKVIRERSFGTREFLGSFVRLDLGWRLASHLAFVLGAEHRVVQRDDGSHLWWRPVFGGIRLQ